MAGLCLTYTAIAIQLSPLLEASKQQQNYLAINTNATTSNETLPSTPLWQFFLILYNWTCRF